MDQQEVEEPKKAESSMNKNEIYSITKLLRQKHDELEETIINEANPDELLVDLSFTIRCLIDITELMIRED